MTMSITVFRSKHWPNLIYPLKVRCQRHLFVKLRTLCEECRSIKVLYFKHAGPGFRRSCRQFRSMDFEKSLSIKDTAKNVADGGVDAEDGLRGGCPKGQKAVGQALSIGKGISFQSF